MEMYVSPPDVVVRICHFSSLFVDRPLPDELLIVLMPSVQLFYPVQPVIGCFDMAYLAHDAPQENAGRCSGMLSEPCQAFTFYMHHASLPGCVRIDIFDCTDDAVSSVSGEAGYAQAHCPECLKVLDYLMLVLFLGKAVIYR